MRRHLFTIMSAVSLVLCIATATIWVQSYWQNKQILICNIRSKAYDSTISAGWEQDVVEFGVLRRSKPPDRTNLNEPVLNWQWQEFVSGPMRTRTWWDRRGFFWATGTYPFPDKHTVWTWQVGVPCWLVMLTTGVIPTLWLRQSRQRRRRLLRQRHGLCRTCGYDLRASTERCPECGTPFPADLVRKPVV